MSEGEQQVQQNAQKQEKSRYKILLLVPTLLFLVSVGILVNQYMQTGDWILRGTELKGGTSLSIALKDEVINIDKLETTLSQKFGHADVRELKGLGGRELTIEVSGDVKAEDLLSEVKAAGIPTEIHSLRSIGPALGASFWSQVQIGMVISFILMGIVIFILFRNFIPSMNTILATLYDIIETLAIMQLLQIPLTLASFAGLLMLIGYSVDTDVLLATRTFRGTEKVSKRVSGAIMTGMTMTLTTLGALVALLVSNLSPVLSQIAIVLIIGLLVDMINTWIQNATVIRWYTERKEKLQ